MPSAARGRAERIGLDRIGLAAALISALSWATTGPFVRVLDGFAPMFIVAGRCAVALAAALVLVGFARDSGVIAALRQPLAWALAALMSAYYALAVVAFVTAPIADVALLITLSPPFALAWRALRRAPIATAEWLGSALAIVGVAIIIWPGGTPLAGFEQRWQGDLLALAGAAAMAAYAIAYGHAAAAQRAPDARAVTAMSFVLATLVFGAYSLISGEWPAGATLIQPGTLAAFAGLGIIATVTPSLTYAIASSRLSAVATSASRLLTPVLATLLGALFIGELPAATFWPGGALVLTGLWVLLR